MLEHLALTGRRLSDLVAGLPPMAMVKERVPMEPNRIFSALQDFREAVQEVEDAEVDLSDGVRVAWPDAWVHVRASNTESLIRVIGEADRPERAQAAVEWARERLGQ